MDIPFFRTAHSAPMQEEYSQQKYQKEEYKEGRVSIDIDENEVLCQMSKLHDKLSDAYNKLAILNDDLQNKLDKVQGDVRQLYAYLNSAIPALNTVELISLRTQNTKNNEFLQSIITQLILAPKPTQELSDVAKIIAQASSPKTEQVVESEYVKEEDDRSPEDILNEMDTKDILDYVKRRKGYNPNRLP